MIRKFFENFERHYYAFLYYISATSALLTLKFSLLLNSRVHHLLRISQNIFAIVIFKINFCQQKSSGNFTQLINLLCKIFFANKISNKYSRGKTMRSIQKVVHGLPHFASGPIIKGFNRGSKELGNKKLTNREIFRKLLIFCLIFRNSNR